MGHFLSRNLGVRRLALVAAAIGVLAGNAWNTRHPVGVQVRRWNNAHLREAEAERPDLTLAEAPDHSFLALMERCGSEPCRIYDSSDWLGQRGRFPPGADRATEWWEYWECIYLLGPLIAGAMACWLAVHTVAWVADGFRAGAG